MGLASFPRLVLDANLLIQVDKQNPPGLRRLLRQAAQNGRLSLPTLVIGKLRKYRGQRQWLRTFLDNSQSRLETRFFTGEEHSLFTEKLLGHPELANDDVQALVIAKQRGWFLVSSENALRRAAQQQGVSLLNSLNGLQQHLEGRFL